MWVIVWTDRTSGKSGVLKTPGDRSRETAVAHARAMRVLFPERALSVVWVQPLSRAYS